METLQHPCHHHALNLRLIGEDCTDLRCEACEIKIQGSAYCCEECRFLLHKSCAEVASHIQYPFHQQHPLKMFHGRPSCLLHNPLHDCRVCGTSSYSFYFHCDDCQTRFCFCCVVDTMPDEDFHTRPVDDLTMHHFAHEHRLTSCCIGMRGKIECRVCMDKITGEAYGCYECFFFLHRNCASSPREMIHPFHLEHPLTLLLDLPIDTNCNICDNNSHSRTRDKIFFCSSGFLSHLKCRSRYSCVQCKFNLGFNCAVSTTEFSVSEDSGLSINHFAHQHELKPFHLKMKNPILCKACWENISGEVYGCIQWLFFLHKSCTQLPPMIEHPLHEEHSLTLVPKSPDDSVSLHCFSCEKSTESYAFTFSCQACKFVLDVKCALETLACLDQGGLVSIEHTFHDHPLQLCNWKGCDKCLACKEYVHEGLAYKCHLKQCREPKGNEMKKIVLLHRSCVESSMEMQHPFNEMQHPYHTQHKLTFQDNSKEESFSCTACLFEQSYSSYWCCAECNFFLDAECASQNLTFKHPLHQHGLSHFGRIGKCLPCQACGKRCGVDLYRCMQCNFNIHSECVPKLPTKVKHKFHFHQLTLAGYFVEDDSGEYICEFCGKTRDLELGVYYCEECPREITLTADMECALSGAEDLAYKDLADTVRRILKGSPEVARLDKEIASVKARKDALSEKLDLLNKELRHLKQERREALLGVEEREHKLDEQPELT